MILSDTIHYRPDGTVSSVQRVTRETFTKPSGAEGFEDVTSEVSLDALNAHLGEAYAGMDTHNKALEAQIVQEREAARAMHERAMLEQASNHNLAIDNAANALAALEAEAKAQITARDAEIANYRATVDQLAARAAQAEEKLAAIAAVASPPAA